MRTTKWIALAAMLVTPAAAHAQNDWHWSRAMTRGNTIEIRGVIGDITATPSSGGEVEVIAHITHDDGDRTSVRIVPVEFDGGVVICALYRQDRDDSSQECTPEGRHSSSTGRSHNNNGNNNNDTHVDFEVRVPRGVRFEGNTVVGDVEATGMTAYTKAASVSGNVRIATTDLAAASSVSGSVDVTMGRTDWTGSLGFSSVSGDVTITLPSDLNADVSASNVSGDIESDWPVTIRSRIASHTMRGTIGSGGRSLSLSSVSGDIRLLRAR